MRAIRISPDNVVQRIDVDLNNLRDLQNLVGGYIETVPGRFNTTCILNEEGKLQHLAPNALATAFARLLHGDIVVGEMIVCGPVDDEGNMTAISDEAAEYLLSVLQTA